MSGYRVIPRRVALALAVALLVLLALCSALASRPQGSARCVEDMPCWQCSTMGNLVCGPEVGR